MQDWQQLKSAEQYSLYSKWERENRGKITTELREAYTRFREHPHSSVSWSADFGACIGFPLLLLGGLWVCTTGTLNEWLIVAILVGFGFWLRFYQKHTIDLACRYFFEDTQQKEILNDYVDRCKEIALASSTSSEEYDYIDSFYEYCRHKVLSDRFRYYESLVLSNHCNHVVYDPDKMR